MKMVFNLNGENVLSPCDDNVFLAVHNPDEAVFVHPHHVTGEKPAVSQGLRCGLRILVILPHDPISTDTEFARRSSGDNLPVIINDLILPVKSGKSNGANLMFVADTEIQPAAVPVDSLRPKLVSYCMPGKYLLQCFTSAGGDGLGSHVQESPLVYLVVGQFHRSTVQFDQDVLDPWNETPEDRSSLLAYSLKNPFRGEALENDCLARDDKVAKPVHLRSRVVEGRDEDKHVILCLSVVHIFNDTGIEHVVVGKEDRLRLSCCA